MAKKVFIGVGHGGKDPGAVANGFKESQFNLDVAKACAEALKNNGVSVKLSRESDVSEDLATRIKEAKAYKPNLAVDIHFNAGGGDGCEVYHSKTSKTDDALAKNILYELYMIGQNMHSTTPTKIESGMKTKVTSSGTDYFGFVRQLTVDSKIPAVLVECAYIDNKKDIAIADTLAERKIMGVAIAKGILKTLGITYKEKSTETKTEPAKENLYAKGRKISLKNVSLYPNSASSKPTKQVSGIFYLYDGKNFLNRYRITNSLSRVGKTPVGSNVTGYIKKSDIK